MCGVGGGVGAGVGGGVGGGVGAGDCVGDEDGAVVGLSLQKHEVSVNNSQASPLF